MITIMVLLFYPAEILEYKSPMDGRHFQSPIVLNLLFIKTCQTFYHDNIYIYIF